MTYPTRLIEVAPVSLVAVEGETARRVPVAERARSLFGKDKARTQNAETKRRWASRQMDLSAATAQAETGAEPPADPSAFGVLPAVSTVLHRVHQSMILFAAGHNEALKRFLVEDGAGNDQRFWRLAQALSALYAATKDEKRWLDGVLARKRGLGF